MEEREYRDCGSCKWFGECEILKMQPACQEHRHREKIKSTKGESMFTEKHHKAIAEIIKRNQERIHIEDIEHTANGLPCLHPHIIGDLADYFAKNNNRFDRDKFFEACYL